MELPDKNAESEGRSFAFFTTLVITSILPVGLLLGQRSLRSTAQEYGLELSSLVFWLLQPAAIVILGLLPAIVFVKEYLVTKNSYRSWLNLAALNVGILTLIVCGLSLLRGIVGGVADD